MKLLSLNTWGGKYFPPLINFFKEKNGEIDIFCFQEVTDNSQGVTTYPLCKPDLLDQLKYTFQQYRSFYFPAIVGYDDEANLVNFDLKYGQAIFIKESIRVLNYEEYFIVRDQNFRRLKKDFSNLATPLQSLQFVNGAMKYSVFNFHGTSVPANKLDSPRRLKETSRVLEIIKASSGKKILTGDFNLLPITQSIKRYEGVLKNLIAVFNIKITRSKLTPHYGKKSFQPFADYMFVSDNIKVKDFQVPQIEISDHLPIILEFE